MHFQLEIKYVSPRLGSVPAVPLVTQSPPKCIGDRVRWETSISEHSWEEAVPPEARGPKENNKITSQETFHPHISGF